MRGSDDAEPVTGQALVARELRRHRERAGLSISQLAARVGYSRTYISTSEKPGAGLVSACVVERIDNELNAGGALIALRAEAENERQNRRRGGVENSSARASVSATASPRLTASNPVEPACSAADGPSWPVGDVDLGRLSAARIGADDVAVLRRAVRLIASQTQVIGGGSLHQAAAGLYERLYRLVEKSEHSHAVGRDLVLVAAEAAIGAGWLAYDVGDQVAARRLYTDALFLAGQIEDDDAVARALNALALQSAHLADAGRRPGPSRESLRLSERLAGLAHMTGSPRLRAVAAGHEVVARALVDDGDGFASAVGRAWRAADGLGGRSEESPWLHFVDPAGVAMFVARGHRYRRAPAVAVAVITEHGHAGEVTPWNRVNYQAQLAATVAEAGDTARAIELGRAVVDDMGAAAISSPRTVALLDPVRELGGTSLGPDGDGL